MILTDLSSGYNRLDRWKTWKKKMLGGGERERSGGRQTASRL